MNKNARKIQAAEVVYLRSKKSLAVGLNGMKNQNVWKFQLLGLCSHVK
jgi:hypothetical protein